MEVESNGSITLYSLGQEEEEEEGGGRGELASGDYSFATSRLRCRVVCERSARKKRGQV